MEDLFVFIQKPGLNIRAFRFDEATQKFTSPELSRYAEHLMRPGVKKIVYQQTPIPILWALRTDGVILSMTYSPENGIMAWTELEIDSSAQILDIAVTTLYSGRQTLTAAILYDGDPVVCQMYDIDDNFSTIKTTQFLDLSEIHYCGPDNTGEIERKHGGAVTLDSAIVRNQAQHYMVLDNDGGTVISGTKYNNLTGANMHISKAQWYVDQLYSEYRAYVAGTGPTLDWGDLEKWFSFTGYVLNGPVITSLTSGWNPGTMSMSAITFELVPDENNLTAFQFSLPSHTADCDAFKTGVGPDGDEDFLLYFNIFIETDQWDGQYFSVLGGDYGTQGYGVVFDAVNNKLIWWSEDGSSNSVEISGAITRNAWHSVFILNCEGKSGAGYKQTALFIDSVLMDRDTAETAYNGGNAAGYFGASPSYFAPRMKLTHMVGCQVPTAQKVLNWETEAEFYKARNLMDMPNAAAGFLHPYTPKNPAQNDDYSTDVPLGPGILFGEAHWLVMLFPCIEDAVTYPGELVDYMKYYSIDDDYGHHNMTISGGAYTADVPILADPAGECIYLNPGTDYMKLDTGQLESGGALYQAEEATITFNFKYNTADFAVDTNYIIFGGDKDNGSGKPGGPYIIFRNDSVNGITITVGVAFYNGSSTVYVEASKNSLATYLPNNTWYELRLCIDAKRGAFWLWGRDRLETGSSEYGNLLVFGGGTTVYQYIVWDYDANGFKFGGLANGPAGYQTGLIAKYYFIVFLDVCVTDHEYGLNNYNNFGIYQFADSKWDFLISDPVDITWTPCQTASFHWMPHADSQLYFVVDGSSPVPLTVYTEGYVDQGIVFNTMYGGLGYQSYVRLLRHPRLAGMMRRVQQLDLLVSDSATGSVGDSLTNTSPLSYDDNLAYDQALEVYTGVLSKTFPGGHDKDGDVYIIASDGLPFNLMQVVQYLTVGDS
jgi:hypothetical protein